MSAISVVDTRPTRTPRFDRRTVVILSIMAKLGCRPARSDSARHAIAGTGRHSYCPHDAGQNLEEDETWSTTGHFGISYWGGVGATALIGTFPGSQGDRERFTLAHELGHMVLHSYRP
jgi:hypothetical protein